MVDPLNPADPPTPPDGPDSMDDPLLDALERSIEQPSGFSDSLVQNPEPAMDDLACQLSQLEDSIEKAPVVPPGVGGMPGMLNESPDPNELPGTEMLPLEESEEGFLGLEGRLEDSNDALKTSQGDLTSSDPEVRSPRVCRSRSSAKSGPRGSGRSNRSRPGLRSRIGGSRPRGRTMIRLARDSRICPDNHELVPKEACRSCDKHRHWPEGTDEEPEECWHDWQDRREPGDQGEDEE